MADNFGLKIGVEGEKEFKNNKIYVQAGAGIVQTAYQIMKIMNAQTKQKQ